MSRTRGTVGEKSGVCSQGGDRHGAKATGTLGLEADECWEGMGTRLRLGLLEASLRSEGC